LAWNLPLGYTLCATSVIAPWEVGHAAILRGRLPDFHVYRKPRHAVSFVLSGTAQIEWKDRTRLARFVARPGGFSIIPDGGATAFRSDQTLESLNLSIEQRHLDAIADREFRPHSGTVELQAAYQRTTPEIVALGQAFAAVIRSPRKGTGLYAESLWTQIVVQLLWNYSSLAEQTEVPIDRLCDSRVRRVVDYLESSLSDEISLADLAELAGLSPNHFLNAFKKATGKTPHRYLTERRVAKACELLRNPQTPIAVVALAVGFSSQSHFTTVFGRLKKTTPASYRAQLLGLRHGPLG
jgi:AraC family transcriptional regulator